MNLMQEFDQHSFTWTDVHRLVKKYWLLVFVVFLTGTIATWASLQIFFTEQYETKARLLVKVGRENAETPATVKRGQVVSQGVRIADINTEVEILSSRSLIEEVVDELGPESFKNELVRPDDLWGQTKYYAKLTAREIKGYYYEFLILANIQKRLDLREQAIIKVAEGLKVEPVKESDILVLKLRLPDPQLSLNVANALLARYLRERIEARKTSAGSEFFATRAAEFRVRLSRLREERNRIMQEWNLYSPSEQTSLWLERLNEIESRRIFGTSEMAELSKESRTVKMEMSRIPDFLEKEKVEARNPSIQSIKERITALEVERLKIQNRYLPDSEPVKKTGREIASLKKLLEQEEATIDSAVTREANPIKRELVQGLENRQIDLAGLQARLSGLEAPVGEITRDLRNLRIGIDQFTEIDREFRLVEENYIFYSKRLEEARMSEELDTRRVANVSVVANPEYPLFPISPRKLFYLKIAMPVFLLLGIALAALLETMDDRITSEEDLAGMDEVDFLGSVPLDSRLFPALGKS